MEVTENFCIGLLFYLLIGIDGKVDDSELDKFYELAKQFKLDEDKKEFKVTEAKIPDTGFSLQFPGKLYLFGKPMKNFDELYYSVALVTSSGKRIYTGICDYKDPFNGKNENYYYVPDVSDEDLLEAEKLVSGGTDEIIAIGNSILNSFDISSEDYVESVWLEYLEYTKGHRNRRYYPNGTFEIPEDPEAITAKIYKLDKLSVKELYKYKRFQSINDEKIMFSKLNSFSEIERKQILWGLVNLSFSDSEYSINEKKFIKCFTDFSPELNNAEICEIIDCGRTLLSLENQKEFVNADFSLSDTEKENAVAAIDKDYKIVLNQLKYTLSLGEE